MAEQQINEKRYEKENSVEEAEEAEETTEATSVRNESSDNGSLWLRFL